MTGVDSAITEYVLSAYKYLHSIPETALQEYKTSEYIKDCLEEIGCTVNKNIAGTTALIGTLPMKNPGPVIVLRADMDALMYLDENGKRYAKHTCGHDAHSAMVLTCARRFAMEGGLPQGELRVLFQPAEETMQGAKIVIGSGVLADADAIIGIHLRPASEAGLHQATPALCHGAVCQLHLKIHGKAAHAGRPQQGINALEAAAEAVVAVKKLRFDNSIPHSVKVTNISCGGNASNVIPACADMMFDVRSQNNNSMKLMVEQIKNTIVEATKEIGATVEFISEERTVAAQYDTQMCACAKRAIESVLGEVLPPIYTVGSEDFHYYSEALQIKPVYIGLGAGMIGGLHSENMSFDTSALIDGVNILYETALEAVRMYRKIAKQKEM